MKQTNENGPLTREKTELLSETEATNQINNWKFYQSWWFTWKLDGLLSRHEDIRLKIIQEDYIRSEEIHNFNVVCTN